jgi:hypothetical protein
MDKLEWFQLDRQKRVEYLQEKLDKLSTPLDVHSKKQLEKQIFEILSWEQKYDK